LPPARWADLAIVGSGLASGEGISVAEAWRRHDSAMAAWREGRARSTGEGELDLLSLKRQLAYELTRRCRACALRCGARRVTGEAGICGARAPEDARLANVQVVAGEEAFLSPTIAIWLAGCPEQCVGCLYKPLISASRGVRFDSGRLASVLAKMAAGGEVTSLMALGGNPDVHLARWLDVLVALAQAGEVPLPFVWNANGQSTRRSLELLDGVVSVYLLDLKFRSEACAKANGAERLALRRVAQSSGRPRRRTSRSSFGCSYGPAMSTAALGLS